MTTKPDPVEHAATRGGRWPAIVGSAIAAGTVLILLGLAVNAALANSPSSGADFQVSDALWILMTWAPFGLVGGLLVARRPQHPVGWLLATIGLSVMLTFALEAIAAEATAREWTGRWISWTAWVAGWVYAPVIPALGLLLASFPSGQITNRLLARLAPAQYATIAAIALLRGLRPGSTDVSGIPSPIHSPVGRELLDPMLEVATGFAVVFFIVAGADLVIRFVRATGVERAQLKWFAAAFGFLVGAFLLVQLILATLLESIEGELGELVWVTPFMLGLGGMASAIGIAVLRYRLFEIDRVVSRTVSYLLLTALLLGVYAAGVLGVGAFLPGERSDLLVAGSTLAVAALFRPLRSRIQHRVDRRFHRARHDATLVAEDFALRLRDEIDLGALRTDLLQTARSSVEPTTAALWLAP